MQETTNSAAALESAAVPVRRTVRFVDVTMDDAAAVANGIEDLYDDKLDVIVVRKAFPTEMFAGVGRELDHDGSSRPWARPNEKDAGGRCATAGAPTRRATPTWLLRRAADRWTRTWRARRSSDRRWSRRSMRASTRRRSLAPCWSGSRADGRLRVPVSQDGRSHLLPAGRRCGGWWMANRSGFTTTITT